MSNLKEGSPEEKAEWLAAQLDPLVRRREYRVVAWVRGLRRAPIWTRKYR